MSSPVADGFRFVIYRNLPGIKFWVAIVNVMICVMTFYPQLLNSVQISQYKTELLRSRLLLITDYTEISNHWSSMLWHFY